MTQSTTPSVRLYCLQWASEVAIRLGIVISVWMITMLLSWANPEWMGTFKVQCVCCSLRQRRGDPKRGGNGDSCWGHWDRLKHYAEWIIVRKNVTEIEENYWLPPPHSLHPPPPPLPLDVKLWMDVCVDAAYRLRDWSNWSPCNSSIYEWKKRPVSSDVCQVASPYTDRIVPNNPAL